MTDEILALGEGKKALILAPVVVGRKGEHTKILSDLQKEGFSRVRIDGVVQRLEGEPVKLDKKFKHTIDVVVDRAIAENPESPLFIVGHSMGGYGAALYGHLHPGKVDGYVLSGAWTRDNKGLGTGAVEADAPDSAYMPNELGDGVCSDPSVGEAYMADPYVIKEMSFGLFRALHKGHAWMRENASRFVDPVLILHGGDDGLVAPKDSLELYEQIASWDKSLRIYAGLYHEIFNEYDKDAVIEDALDWLNLHADLEFIDVEEEEVEDDE